MPDKVEILERRTVFQQAIFRVEAARLRHEQYDGSTSEELTRLVLDRGDAVAAVVHNITENTLILTEQFRYPTYKGTGGWLAELPAGMVGENEDPADAMRRELDEETGYTVAALHPISTFYLSPGGSSERVFLFYARVTATSRTGAGGGVITEGEDIRTLALPLSEISDALAANRFPDAKTIIGLQWVLLNRSTLAHHTS